MKPVSKTPARRQRSESASAGNGDVSVRLCEPGVEGCRPLKPARISDVLSQPDILLWVNVRDPGPAELEMLRDEFGFHRLALEDAARQQQRPKVDEYPGYFFVVLYVPLPAEDDAPVRIVEVDLFVGRNYLVTLHRGEIPALEEADQRWEKADAELRDRVGFLVYTVVDALIDDYFPVVDTIEDRLDAVELALFQGNRGAQPTELLAVKRSLFTLRKAVYPMREVFNTFLRRDNALFPEETYPYFQDVYDHVLRLLDTIDIQRDMATGVLDAHLAIISNRLNETVKTLTTVAICVAVAGAVFGAWGMNFKNVPLDYLGLKGFAVLCGAVVILIGLALLWARKRGLWGEKGF